MRSSFSTKLLGVSTALVLGACTPDWKPGFTSTSLAFGTIPVGASYGRTLTFGVTEAVALDSFEFQGNDPGDFGLQGIDQDLSQLPAHFPKSPTKDPITNRLFVTFTPAQTPAASASLILHLHHDVPAPQKPGDYDDVTISLTGNGGDAPLFDVKPGAVDFGTLGVGKTATVNLTLTSDMSIQNGKGILKSVTTDGGTGELNYTGAGESNEAIFPDNHTLAGTAIFSPQASGVRTGHYSFNFLLSDQPESYTIAGTGTGSWWNVPTEVMLSSTQDAMGNYPVAMQSVVLENIAARSLTVSAANFAPDQSQLSGHVAVQVTSGALPSALGSGGMVTTQLTLTGGSLPPGQYTGKLTLSTDQGDAVVTVNVNLAPKPMMGDAGP